MRLQHEYDSFFFVADWHALTTHYEDRDVIERNVYDMVIDWIAAGLDPDLCTIFIQSRLPEHAERLIQTRQARFPTFGLERLLGAIGGLLCGVAQALGHRGRVAIA